MLVEKIAVHRIDLPKSNPPLRTFCKRGIEELAESIRIIGLVQPIVLRPHPDVPERYVVV